MAGNTEVFLWGDWEKAERIFDGFESKAQLVVYTALEATAVGIKNRIKNNIYTGKYAENWVPLAPSTIARKAKEGLDPRTLIALGEYVRAFEVWREGNEFAIGVKDADIAEVGKVMEYGSKKVPARPHLRIELERSRAERMPLVREAFAKILRGEI